MIYDVIIIGAGPAGMFTGCHIDKGLKTLIIEKNNMPGVKLLMTGKGQCNVTNMSDMRQYVNNYGENGKRVRQILYKYNNQKVISYFEDRQVPMMVREDQKAFPTSLNAQDVLDALMSNLRENKVSIKYNEEVLDIQYVEDIKGFSIITNNEKYVSKSLVVATGGCSYPTSGSDGKMFNILKKLDIPVTKLKPSLVPVYVKDYPFSALSGISFKDIKIAVYRHNKKIHTCFGDLLLTHDCFSGPAVINHSRYLEIGDEIKINYLGEGNIDQVLGELKVVVAQSTSQLNTIIKQFYDLPKRFTTDLFNRLSIDGEKKARQTSSRELTRIVHMIMEDVFVVKKLGDYNIAMATAGGVSLSDIHSNTVESLSYPNLYYVGEVLDIDGDTGGYNLQFAFASGKNAADRINERLYKCFKEQIIK